MYVYIFLQHFCYGTEYATDYQAYTSSLEHFCSISDIEEFPLQRKIIKSHGECSFTIDNDLRGRMDILALQIQMLITK